MHAAFEWPLRCSGWTALPQMQSLCEILPLECHFDGCRFDVTDVKGKVMQKPWRVQTDLPCLEEPLNRRCSKDH